ncbi:MAG TPA: 2-oxoglutarate and iron-dependent oxygenase domain-containing protein [Acidimicrobiales bacterium]|nr:2-oxoglutarate and iron-dependent oxygenase domain-containing protein [Acidimicrobiales bacterium]
MAVIPEIDIEPLLVRDPAADAAAMVVAAEIDAACREVGFFYVIGHGVNPGLQDQLDSLARDFFGRPEEEKAEIALARGGRAWRGWFPVGGELTGGIPDDKEGLYFGGQLDPAHPRVEAGTPMHGANLFPRRPAELGPVVVAYMEAMTAVGQAILSGMALGLGLRSSWFTEQLTSDPLILLRIFRYPALAGADGGRWSVGEHTDYGLLTVLGQDSSGGLQVRTGDGDGFIDVAPRPGTFVCNLGDMLERLTGGRYRSTRHRVRNAGSGDRLSFPFFLDPSWDARVERLPIVDRPADDDGGRRWDQVSVHGFEGSYGDYILAKVGKVFPDLAAQALDQSSTP